MFMVNLLLGALTRRRSGNILACMLHQDYPADAKAIDLRGRLIQVFFGTATAMTRYTNASQLRALAVTTSTRIEALPNVPTVAEIFPDTKRATGSHRCSRGDTAKYH